ncbi:MAG: S9 family peptidase [Nevskiaceae bacterium]|nr:MAG: S9 family peptidase [Nevskiaceae bacterium]TAM30478.1 MAG: S9 family peptidase [Nevskiaceae bacterium]
MKSALQRLSLCFAYALMPSLAAAATDYPATPRGEMVEDYFGTAVADPYRWLEDVDAAETLSWVKAQQALADPLLAALPERAPLKQRLTELWNFERRSTPRSVAGQRFYLKNDGLQNQAELMVQAGRSARALLDPNLLSKDGTTALTQWEPSANATTLSYALAEAGSDWEVIRFRTVATASDLPDELRRVKFSGQVWTKDERGLLYSRYPEPKPSTDNAGKTFERLENHTLYYHRLGTPQSEDLVVHAPEDPSWTAVGDLSDDGRYALAYVTEGASDNNRLYVYDLKDPLKPEFGGQPLLLLGKDFQRSYTVIGSEGSILYVLTTDGAPKKRVVAIDLKHPEPQHWLGVVPEGADVIDSVTHVGGQLLVKTLHDASSRLSRYSLSGQKLGEVRLPGIGDVSGITGKPGQAEAYFQFTGFAQPASNYRLTMKTGQAQLDWAPKLAFQPADYQTEQVFYTSKDGTKVPMFISYKKGLKKNGANPTLLYGYGGFNISLSPTFSPQNLAWMELGGIYAQPSLRGGGEYGEAWHLAGTRERKQNVFDDFAAAAEYLIAHKYTSAKHLGIHGRSNGGLLVGATLNQHPELFAAAVPGVGVMDMLRFHKFTIGAAWREDYGSSETAEGFAYLYPYSPVHNVKPGLKYPPTLTITADHDDRVVPGHSFKYAAAMQWANVGNPNPQLIRIEERGGHGAGKPVGKKIDEVADVLAFLVHYTK